MGKYCPDNSMDVFLNYLADSDELTICAGSPLNYAESHTGSSILARFSCTSGCFVVADDVSGKKVTIAARTSGSITLSGEANSVCLNKVADTTFRYSTSCSAQILTAGGQIDTSSFKINLQDAV
jgi:hypothetical protein